jgi:hypothetical protein
MLSFARPPALQTAPAAGRPRQVEDIRDITRYGIMSTPGVVIEGQVVHAGGMPSRSKVEAWLGGVAAS